MRGCAPGTAYFIPAYVGAWLVGGSFPGSDVRLGFVAAAAAPRRSRASLAAVNSVHSVHERIQPGARDTRVTQAGGGGCRPVQYESHRLQSPSIASHSFSHT